MKKYWFRNKRYGYGWFPASWEGWLVMAVWLVFFVAIFRNADRHSHSVSDTLYGIILPTWASVAVLLIIAWKTGEKVEWRWNGKPWPKKDRTPKQQ